MIFLLLTIQLLSMQYRALVQQSDINAAQAKVLYTKVLAGNRDTSQVKVLMKLATYQIMKKGEHKADLDQIKMDVSKAVPIVLIVNETIANSLKYEFPNGRKCAITVSLNQRDNQVVLKITDNGIGFSDQDQHQPSSQGMGQIKGLSKSLHAVTSISATEGTCITLNFYNGHEIV